MAILTINTGTGANKGDGDSIRTAFNKINYNFSTLENVYIAAGVASFNGQGGVVTFTSTDIVRELGFLPYPNSNPNGYVSSANLANYVTLSYLDNQGFVSTATLESYNYAPISYVTSALQNYATYLYVDTQGFITAGQLTGYNFITRTDLLGYEYQTATGVDTIVRNNLAGYVTTATLGSYATQNYVQTYVANIGLNTNKISTQGAQLRIYSGGKLEVVDAVSLVNSITSSTIISSPSDNKSVTLGALSSWQTDLTQYPNGGGPADPSLTVVTSPTLWKFDGVDASLNIPTTWTRYFSNVGTVERPYIPPSQAFTLPTSKGITNGYPRMVGIDHTNTQFVSIIDRSLYINQSNPLEVYYGSKTWKYGKSVNLSVDTARTDVVTVYSPSIPNTVTGSRNETKVGFNYIDISQGGVAVEAHVGEIFLRTNRSLQDRNQNGTGVWTDGSPVIANETFEYKFNPDFMTFPFGTVISDGYAPLGFNNGVVTGNTPSAGGRAEYQFRLDIAKESSLVIKTTNTAGTTSTWTFNTSGILTLPVGGDIRDSSGASVLGGGGGGSTAYTPATPANWVGSPTVGTVTAGLDELAGRMVVVEGGTSTLVNGASTLSLGSDGVLTLPTGAIIASDVGIDLIQAAGGNQLILDSPTSLSIITNDALNVPSQTWTFSTIGTLTLPNGAVLKDDNSAIGLGFNAGQYSQGINAVAIGTNAGQNTQTSIAVAIGFRAGRNTQGLGAVALGANSGATNQGANAVAIGNFAGYTNQTAGSIVINGSGSVLEATQAGLYIDPVREAYGSKALYYNQITKEITYDTVNINSTSSYINFSTYPPTAGVITFANGSQQSTAWAGIPGPFADDAAAAIGGVSIGYPYYKTGTGGQVFVRLT